MERAGSREPVFQSTADRSSSARLQRDGSCGWLELGHQLQLGFDFALNLISTDERNCVYASTYVLWHRFAQLPPKPGLPELRFLNFFRVIPRSTKDPERQL